MADYILQENGDKILQETGDGILLQTQELSTTYTSDTNLLKASISAVLTSDAIFTPTRCVYSKSTETDLPADDTNLTLFTSTEYTNVLAEDGDYATQELDGTDYTIVEFKEKKLSQSSFSVTWIGQSKLAPSSSAVYLQVYNKNSTTWETLDIDNTASHDADITLSGRQSTNLQDYYNGTNWLSFRIYQENV